MSKHHPESPVEFSTLVELLRWRALWQPEQKAYTFLLDGEVEEQHLTYGELDCQARAIAAVLQSLTASGERALLLYTPGLDFIAAFFGCLYAEVIAVPAYPPRTNSRSIDRIQNIVADAQATVVLATTQILSNLEQRFADALDLKALNLIATDDVSRELAETWQAPTVSSNTLAYLQYTSGSTSKPKGVMISHGNALHNSTDLALAWETKSDSVLVSWLPHFHDFGLVYGIIQPVHQGFPCVLMAPTSFIQQPLRWLQAISHYKATHSGAPNFAYELCVSKIAPQQRATLDLSSWCVAVNGAEPICQETLQRFAEVFNPCGFRWSTFCPGYGLAEATLKVSAARKAEMAISCTIQASALEKHHLIKLAENGQAVRTLVGCGSTLLDTKVFIVNPTSLTQCLPDQVGEIWVSGSSVAHGYWNRPQETERTFRAYLADTGEGPFLRTGDLGFIKDGQLFVTGRLKDLIIIRGHNHYPQDIERTLEDSHPALRMGCGAAFSVKVDGEERLVVAQEVERSYVRNLNVDEVIGAICQAVAEQHELQVYAVLLLKTGSIPKTSSGKIQRQACRAAFLDRSLEAIGDWTDSHGQIKLKDLQADVESLVQQLQTRKQCSLLNQNNTEESSLQKASPAAAAIQVWLAVQIAERLRVDPNDLDVQQPFFHYGLDSMASVSISGALEQWLERRLSPTLVYDYPSIAALAQYLAADSNTSEISRFNADQKTEEAIAIIGLGCRFPKAKDPESFWQLLRNGVDAITEVPASRWDINAFYDPKPAHPGKMNTRWGGFLEQVDRFDPQFFGISPREAESMDPQQRLLLEVSWEALENAGQAPEQLAGTQTGVFVGICTNDYSRLQFNHPAGTDTYSGTGNAFSIVANRLSYLLDLRGPSWAVDTACSSSLVGIHQACQSLRLRECQLALAGGVNLILTPELTITFSQAKMMASDGRCKTFDAEADGYVRGEGCGILVLKRLSQAVQDGDNILALIRGSAVNQDGRSNGLTAPNGPAQQAVIHQALANAGVTPAQISYVEAHGTGTSLGDPIEVNSLKAVLMQKRIASQQCWISSVKTNIGHLEAAAGIAGLIKVVLSFQHEEIPPHLHLKQLNPHFDLENTPLSIPTEVQKWSGKKQRFAGVSSFGFGGTNAHVVLAEAPPTTSVVRDFERPKHLLALSAKCEQSLQELVQSYAAFLTSNSGASIADICFTANTGRSHFEHRLVAITESTEQLRSLLGAFATGKETAGLVSAKVDSKKRSKVAFLFTGQGSQYVGMGRQLYDTQPTFRKILDHCAQILRPYLEKPLLEVLYPVAGETPLNETAYTQPALFALEYALAQLWQSWGIIPDAVIGHSLGEYVAACVAGVFSLEDGLKLIAERARLMQAQPQEGEMVAVFADEAQITPIIQAYAAEVAIAAINSPQNVVISGKRQAISNIVMTLEAQGVETKKLQVSHAFHSPLMEPMLAAFERVAASVTYSCPQIDLISNVTGKLANAEIATPEYWCHHILQPVRFANSMQTLEQQGYAVFVECGPKPTLLGMGRYCLPTGVGVWLPSLRQGQSDWQQLLNSLGALYIRGVSVDWSGFERDYERRLVQLPTYPFQRQRYWIEATAQQKSLPQFNDSTPIVDLLNRGDTTQLAQLLGKAGNFTAHQLKLLPDLLSVLVKQHQQQVTAASMQDWLYEVEWRPQMRQGQQLSPDYLPAPSEISDRLQPQLAQLTTQPNQAIYSEVLTKLEALSIVYVLDAFKQMGWEFQLGQRFSTAVLAKQLGIVSQHQRLLNRLLEMLGEENLLQQIGSHWEVIQIPNFRDSQEEITTLLTQYPAAIAELTLLERCGCKLAAVLRGECDPLQLLFPEGDLTTTTHLYQNSPVAQVMNTLVQKVVSSALEQLPIGRGVRVLEIGAGTGGTTSYILPHLEAKQTEYVFTDIGALFTSIAAEKFRDYPFVSYQALNIEEDPAAQGFPSHQYDVVVAANVLHATKDLRQTLKHVQQILAPGGMLVLLEGTVRQRWLDLTFGLTEGWWRFTDLNLRSNYPLLSVNQWQELLRQEFKDAVSIAFEAGSLSNQSVIVAQAAQDEPVILERNWLILADSQGIGQKLMAHLQSKGETCNIVFPGNKYEQLTEQEFKINQANPPDFQRLLKAVGTDKPLHGVVHLWSLDAVRTEALTSPDLKVVPDGCGSSLHLVQALVGARFSKAPSLWLVTQGAVPVNTPAQSPTLEGVPGLAQSLLWGMGKVIAQEHPELNCVRVDLEPEAIGDTAPLFAEIWSEAKEDQVAFRDRNRYVARLVRSSLVKDPANYQQLITFRGDSTYLITGGMGGLGLLIARWMVEKGARHLVLVGRSGAKESVTSQLRELEQVGAKVVVAQVDVSEVEQVAQLVSDIEQSLPPLKGIIHAAGVLDDGVLQQQTWERFAHVMAPKVAGSWNLHTLTQNLPLDFFVLFSSAAALLGSSGQANHAAANAFLDTLAYYRRAQGLPGLSINWGAVSKIGAVGKQEIGDRLRAQGIGTIAPPQVLAVLEELFSHSSAQVGVVPIDWSQFRQSADWQFLADFQHPFQQPVEQQSEFLQQLESTPAQKRHFLLIDHVRSQVAKVLGLTSQSINLQQGFFELGMDSLTAMELRTRLQNSLEREVSSTSVFNYPTVETLVDYLETQLLGWEPAADDTDLQQGEQMAALSEVEQPIDEVEASIARALADLETLLRKN